MINLGRYSGRDCPRVYCRPTLPDRVLEGLTLLILILMWVGFCRLPLEDTAEPLTSCILATVLGALMLATAYAPVRLFNFPVRVDAGNIGVQYLLATRLCRCMAVCVTLLTASMVFIDVYVWAKVLVAISGILLPCMLLVYFFLAFRYKGGIL